MPWQREVLGWLLLMMNIQCISHQPKTLIVNADVLTTIIIVVFIGALARPDMEDYSLFCHLYRLLIIHY